MRPIFTRWILGFLVGTLHLSISSRAVYASDCNYNGVPDACDINCDAPGWTCPPDLCGYTSDFEPNGVPNECEGCPFPAEYSSTLEFDGGFGINLELNASGHVQRKANPSPLPFVWIAASDRGTIAKMYTGQPNGQWQTGQVIAEYFTAPDCRGRNPSRTAVDLDGNAWVGNRDEAALLGSAVKIGHVLGGTQVLDSCTHDDRVTLAPPFEYNTCVDRNGDGLITTSSGLPLAWPNGECGQCAACGPLDGNVDSALDECIVLYVRTNGRETRQVSVDRDNNVWAGGHGLSGNGFDYLDGETGQSLAQLPGGCGGYAGLVDCNNVLWSADRSGGPGKLFRHDSSNLSNCCAPPQGVLEPALFCDDEYRTEVLGELLPYLMPVICDALTVVGQSARCPAAPDFYVEISDPPDLVMSVYLNDGGPALRLWFDPNQQLPLHQRALFASVDFGRGGTQEFVGLMSDEVIAFFGEQYDIVKWAEVGYRFASNLLTVTDLCTFRHTYVTFGDIFDCCHEANCHAPLVEFTTAITSALQVGGGNAVDYFNFYFYYASLSICEFTFANTTSAHRAAIRRAIDRVAARIPGCNARPSRFDSRVARQPTTSAPDLAISASESSIPCTSCLPTPSYAVAVDNEGDIWITNFNENTIREVSPDGLQVLNEFFTGGASYDRGVAITFGNNHVWVASSGNAPGPDDVTRLDPITGQVLEVITVGDGPTGIAVDAEGYLWVTNRDGSTVSRIAPSAIPLVQPSTVQTFSLPSAELGDARPYGMTDMTGMVTLQTSAAGTWSAVHDGFRYNSRWARAVWNSEACVVDPLPAGTELVVEIRAADSRAGLTSASYVRVNNGDPVDGVRGRFVQVRVRFRGSCPGAGPSVSPTLCDLQILGTEAASSDCDSDGVPDECEPDCNQNGIPDACDLAASTSVDCNLNYIPDECEISVSASAPPSGPFFYCSAYCDPDCNDNRIPDLCDAISGSDCDGNHVPDECQTDCNSNGVPDACDVDLTDPDQNGLTSDDFNSNGVPDECESLPTGACCHSATLCEVGMVRAECEALGGIFRGSYTQCSPGVCNFGACCGLTGTCSTGSAAACSPPQDFLGYGTTCQTNCCPQPPTGAASCSAATVVPAPIPPLFEPPTSVTVSGTTVAAALSDCPRLPAEPVWWETIDVRGHCAGNAGVQCASDADCPTGDWCDGTCAVLTLEDTCTEPPHLEYATVLFDSCPCGVPIPADSETPSAVDGGRFSLRWMVPAGTYYYPVYSGSEALLGPYQFRITVESCFPAVCCTGSACSEVNKLECRSQGGDWLGDTSPAIPICHIDPSDPTACEVGACCRGPEECNDGTFLDTESECLADHPANRFRGGQQCNQLSGAQSCSSCGIATPDRCRSGQGSLYLTSDSGACISAADDFSPAGNVNQGQMEVCWRGAYHQFEDGEIPTHVHLTSSASPLSDCTALYGDDHFRITIYADDNGRPGSAVASTTLILTAQERAAMQSGDRNGVPIFEYSASVSSLPQLVQGGCYWLEIQNDRAVEDGCYWVWESTTEDFNRRGFQDHAGSSAACDAHVQADMAFCLSLASTPADCAAAAEPPREALAPHDVKKNRYVSFAPANCATPIAFRVEKTQPDGNGWYGWVSWPNGNAISVLSGEMPEPRVWVEPVIHVTGCPIVPVATYEIRATADGGLTFSDPLVVATIDQPGPRYWGDITGSFNGAVWSPPNGFVNVTDIVAQVHYFQGIATKPHLSRVDVHPELPNQLLNVADIFEVVRAFQQTPYPFQTDPNLCAEFAGRGPTALQFSSDNASLEVILSATQIDPGESVHAFVYMNNVLEVGAYEVSLFSVGGDQGEMVLQDLIVDTERSDYIFSGQSIILGIDATGGRLAAAMSNGSGYIAGPGAYIGSFTFQASADAHGLFTISSNPEGSFILDGSANNLPMSPATNAAVRVGPECLSAAECDDGDACTVSQCIDQACEFIPLECSDGDACTSDTCVNGECSFQSMDCNDGDPCTSDVCILGTCTHGSAPVGTPCDDGWFCTATDTCTGAGVCAGTGSPCLPRQICCENTNVCVGATQSCYLEVPE